MDYSFRHSMPGRIRLNVPALGRNRGVSEKFLAWLKAQAGVRSARINYDCASLVLEYDATQEPMLRLMLERLKSASLADLKALCADVTTDAAAPTKQEVSVLSARSPLALPTLSLLMAFSVNPAVMACNIPLMFYNAIPIARRAWKA